MEKPTKHSVAVLVRSGELILSTRRPDNDDEFPGIWGIPAGSYQASESLEELIARIGRQKLGVRLTPMRLLAQGTQDRPAYKLQMELWEVAMEEPLTAPAFQWAPMEILEPGRALGSLCCELALGLAAGKGKSRVSL
jgi:ADP-ribose pyrophosphatase YjhB (NUDIX family)